MKIYVITLQRAVNYGSVLQALATQIKLEELGQDVTLLNYYPERYTDKGKLKRLKGRTKRLNNPVFLLAAQLLIKPSYMKKNFVFDGFIKRYIHQSDIEFATSKEAIGKFDDADAYCTGSDQTWNIHWNEGVDKTLFLDFVPKGKLVFSYSASIGLSELPIKELEEMRPLLEKYEYISMREDSGVEIMNKLGRKDAIQTLDPTLLLTAEEWNKYTDDYCAGQDYVLTYNLHHDPMIDSYAIQLSEKYGCKIFNLSYNWHDIFRHGSLKWCPKVERFLGLIKHARFVIADSFHATVFSILFHKKFVSITPDVASSRISSLLATLGITERMVHRIELSDIEKDINYVEVDKLLNDERKESMNYLNKVVNTTSYTHNKL